MKNIKDYIASGIIEMYVMGLTSATENAEIEVLAFIHPEIKEEIDQVSQSLELIGKNDHKNAERLSGTVKPMLMAIIDYTERLKNGEQPASPPTLNENSSLNDYLPWLVREDMVYEEAFGNTYAKIIGYSPEMLTAIVWMKEGAPYEIHEKEYEKFYIIEGSCNIVTKDEVYSLSPGKYFQIPLHMGHTVEITSKTPCKLILQRMAA